MASSRSYCAHSALEVLETSNKANISFLGYSNVSSHGRTPPSAAGSPLPAGCDGTWSDELLPQAGWEGRGKVLGLCDKHEGWALAPSQAGMLKA